MKSLQKHITENLQIDEAKSKKEAYTKFAKDESEDFKTESSKAIYQLIHRENEKYEYAIYINNDFDESSDDREFLLNKMTKYCQQDDSKKK